MIEIKNCFKSYSKDALFSNLSLKVSEGERIAIIGPSGCGKSTILKYLLGIAQPDSGSIIVDGINLNNISKSELLQVRMKIGMLFQSAALFDSLTISEILPFH